MKNTILVMLSLLLVGCAADREGVQDREKPSPAEIRVKQLEQQLADMEGEYARRVEELKTQYRRNEEEYIRTLDVYLRQVERKDREIADLQAAMREARAQEDRTRAVESREQATAKTPVVPTISVAAPPDPAAMDFIVPPAGRDPDLFPLRVYDISGKRVVTGTHTVSRYVETDEVYRDEYGEKTRAQRREDEMVEEYGYQVTFSVENMTRTPKQMSIRAGVSTQEVTVPAGGVMTDVSVDAAMGSALMVMVGGRTRSYDVKY